MEEYKNEFEDYVTPLDDALKAKRLMKTIKTDQLIALKGMVANEISSYISNF